MRRWRNTSSRWANSWAPTSANKAGTFPGAILPTRTMNVQIVLFNGFDELDAIAPHEIWNMARELKLDVDVQLVTLDGTKDVTASHGLRAQAQGQLGATRPDIVVVPGGGWITRSPVGAWAEAQRGALPGKLAQLLREGVVMASVCTGAMLLAAAGLLKNRTAI